MMLMYQSLSISVVREVCPLSIGKPVDDLPSRRYHVGILPLVHTDIVVMGIHRLTTSAMVLVLRGLTF